jgi:hypothetical protein
MNLTLLNLRELVLQEMDHIPRWPKDHQSLLRMFYWSRRMNGLGRRADMPNDRAAVLRLCLVDLAKYHPGETFAFDAAFFGVPSQ